jgi:hypothetical protein
MERRGLPDDEKGECPICGAAGFSCSPMMVQDDPVQITSLAMIAERSKGMAHITLTEKVWVDASGRATTDERKAARLWGTPGMTVREDDAAAIGYPPKVQAERVQAAKPKAVRRPRGTKVVEGPGGDK